MNYHMTPDPNNDALRALLETLTGFADQLRYELQRGDSPRSYADILHIESVIATARETTAALAASPKNDSAQWAVGAAKEIVAEWITGIKEQYGVGDPPEPLRQVAIRGNAAIIQKHAPIGSSPSAQGEDSARLDWLEKYLMSLSRITSPDMSGLRYVGQCSNPAKERGEGGPSYLRIQGATIRAAIDAARKETAK
jgi:hypothetical protein